MPRVTFRFIVQTPHEVVCDETVRSVRVLTDTGHVGIRAHMEPVVLPVKAGLVVLREESEVKFLGSAGGLLSFDGHEATLFTPLGVVGADATSIEQTLEHALGEPDSELAIRASLGKLEDRILTELRRDGPSTLEGERR